MWKAYWDPKRSAWVIQGQFHQLKPLVINSTLRTSYWVSSPWIPSTSTVGPIFASTPLSMTSATLDQSGTLILGMTPSFTPLALVSSCSTEDWVHEQWVAQHSALPICYSNLTWHIGTPWCLCALPASVFSSCTSRKQFSSQSVKANQSVKSPKKSQKDGKSEPPKHLTQRSGKLNVSMSCMSGTYFYWRF